MELNKIIKRKGHEKEKELLDELISQIESESANNTEEPSEPIELTEPVKAKMIHLMDTFLSYKDKLYKVSAIRKELTSQSTKTMTDLETLMKLYGLTELIKGNNKFVLDRTVKKKPLKKQEFKEVITYVIGNAETVSKIYDTANQMSEETVIEKIKCLKYKK